MIVEMKKYGNDIVVNLGFDVNDYFANVEGSELVLRKIPVLNKPFRYFVLEKTNYYSNRNSFRVTTDNNLAYFTNLNTRLNGCFSESFVYRYNNKIYFFELTSMLYPQIDGSINLNDGISNKITGNSKFLNDVFFSFYQKFLNDSEFIIKDNPIMFLFNTHYKPYYYLQEIKLDLEEQDYLKKNTLSVYISEPVLDFLDKDVDHDKNLQTLHDYNILENLDIFAHNNKIKIRVYTCEHNIEEYESYFKNLVLVNDDIFLKLVSYYIKNNNVVSDTKITNKFICTAYRYEPYRYYILSYLSNEIDNAKITYPKHVDEYSIPNFNLNVIDKPNNIPFINFIVDNDLEASNKLHNGFQYFKKNAPFYIDLSSEVKDNDESFFHNQSNKFFNEKIYNAYSSSFCSVVCETVFNYHSPVISEKTFICFALKRPFLLAGCPGSLKYLKKLGFKTFDNFWNEDYDLELSHNKRLLKIFKLIDLINSKSYLELDQLLVDMKSVLDYNYNYVKNFYNTGSLLGAK